VHEVDHSPPPSADITDGYSYISSPLTCLVALILTILICFMIFLINITFLNRSSTGFLLNQVLLQWLPYGVADENLTAGQQLTYPRVLCFNSELCAHACVCLCERQSIGSARTTALI
jgi:hypothetical protein